MVEAEGREARCKDEQPVQKVHVEVRGPSFGASPLITSLSGGLLGSSGTLNVGVSTPKLHGFDKLVGCEHREADANGESSGFSSGGHRDACG